MVPEIRRGCSYACIGMVQVDATTQYTQAHSYRDQMEKEINSR